LRKFSLIFDFQKNSTRIFSVGIYIHNIRHVMLNGKIPVEFRVSLTIKSCLMFSTSINDLESGALQGWTIRVVALIIFTLVNLIHIFMLLKNVNRSISCYTIAKFAKIYKV